MANPLVVVEPGDTWESFCKRNNHDVNCSSLEEWDYIDNDVYNKIYDLREEWLKKKESMKPVLNGGIYVPESEMPDQPKTDFKPSSGVITVMEQRLIEYVRNNISNPKWIDFSITPEIALGMVIGCIEGYRELGKGSD